MDIPPDPKPWFVYVLWAIGVVSVAVLGGVARLLHDSKDKVEDISKRDWVYYCTTSMLAGIIIGSWVVDRYGLSVLLIGFSGAAGFGSVQILGLCVAITMNLIKRLFPQSQDTQNERLDQSP